MAKPLIISAFEGTYKDDLKDTSKYSISIIKGLGNSSKGFVSSLKENLATSSAEVIIIPSSIEVQKEMFNEGLNFIGVYPANNACGVFQDRLDELGYPEETVCKMIETWKTRVVDHSWRQLAKRNVIVSDNQYIDDTMIDSLL
jgi:hypothetical protein